MNEQFESFDFDQQSLEMDDSLNFEFVSPQGGTQEIGMPNPTEIIPVNLREPVDEPTLSAVEHTVVSCADLSQLSTVLDCGHTEETLKDVGEDDIPILSSTTDDLRETPKEQLSYVAGDLPLEQNTLEAPEPTDRDSLSGNSNAAEVTSLLLHEENSEDQEVSDNGELESASLPQEVHFEGVAESPDSRSKTGSEAVVKNSISDSDLNQERGEAIDILDKNIHSTEVPVRRSISDDVIADDTLTSGGNSEPKLTRSSSDVVVSPRKSKEVDEMDARVELSSKSLGSLGNLSKGKDLLGVKTLS